MLGFSVSVTKEFFFGGGDFNRQGLEKETERGKFLAA